MDFSEWKSRPDFAVYHQLLDQWAVERLLKAEIPDPPAPVTPKNVPMIWVSLPNPRGNSKP